MGVIETLLWIFRGLVTRPLWHLLGAPSEAKCSRASFLAALFYVNPVVALVILGPLSFIGIFEKIVIFRSVGYKPLVHGWYPVIDFLSHPETEAKVAQALQDAMSIRVVFWFTVLWTGVGALFFIWRGAVLLWQRVNDIGRFQVPLLSAFGIACLIVMLWNQLHLPYTMFSPVLTVGMLLIIGLFPPHNPGNVLKLEVPEGWFSHWVGMPLRQSFSSRTGMALGHREFAMGIIYLYAIQAACAPRLLEPLLSFVIRATQELIPTIIGILASLRWLKDLPFDVQTIKHILIAPYWVLMDFAGIPGYILALSFVVLGTMTYLQFWLCCRFILQTGVWVKPMMVLNVMIALLTLHFSGIIYIAFVAVLIGMALHFSNKVESV
jgi:hypothetical protein